MANINNYVSNTLLSGTSDNDYINNNRECVTINALSGNDTIFNDYADNGSISGGDGDDYIYNYSPNVTIDGDAGRDYIRNPSKLVTINGSAGNDSIYNQGSNVAITGGADDDYIANYNNNNVLIAAGTGDDTISLGISSGNNSIQYTHGDGDDIIYGFNDDDTLSISGGTYSTQTSGNNIIVTVGDGEISLIGAASLSAVNIVVDETSIETNSWKLSGTTAKYGTTSKTLATVKGVKSLDGLSVDGKVITVSNASLNKKAVTISGTGYKLVLGDDVTKSATTKKSWSLSGSTATYKQTKSAYYTIASNKITYHKSTNSNTLATVKGVKSLDGLSVDGKTVTVSNASLNKKAVTISSGYTLKLGSDVTKSTSTAAKWSLSGTTATYKSAKKTTGYKLASNKISYVTASGGKVLATVKGVKSKPTLSGNVVTVKTSNIGASKKVSVSGNYEFDFAAGDYKKTSITGTANADTIKVFGTNAIVTGGKGNDSLVSNSSGGNIFVYSSGDGNDVITNFAATDKLSIKSAATYSVSGSDVVFTVGTGSITLKDAKDKTFTYYDSGGEKTYSNVTVKPYTVKGKGVTLTSAYTDTEFDVSTVKSGSKIVTIDAAKVNQGLEIIGNAKTNRITGTSKKDYINGDAGNDLIIGGNGNDTLRGDYGNDTLTGGNGSDVFIYYSDDGNDVISDYKAEDSIWISGNVEVSTKRSDVVLTVDNGSITVKNAHEKKIGVTYFENDIEHDFINGKQSVTFEGKNDVIISKNYWKTSFDVANFDNRRNVNAAAVTHELKITGNRLANKIIGGSGKNTLIGGGGNDTLQGGDKADVFVYAKGDGNDVIFDYGENDIISITSGTATTSVNGDTVILSVGNGKISLDGAADKTVTYYDDNGRVSKIYSNNANDDMWFLDDAEFISADNQLSSLVRDGAINYSDLQTNNSLSLTTARLEQELIATPTPLKTLSKNFSGAN